MAPSVVYRGGGRAMEPCAKQRSGQRVGERRRGPAARATRPNAKVDFSELVGVGPTLAARIGTELGIKSFEQLELAAFTGRLATIAGVGERRAKTIKSQLSDKLASRVSSSPQGTWPVPKVSEILGVDREYRSRAKRGSLPRVAPKRFNPTGAAWLPVLRTSSGAINYTAFFSNTEQAHRARKTHSWVVVLAERDGSVNQYTVVNETRGRWHGERVVRGREAECLEYYQNRAA